MEKMIKLISKNPLVEKIVKGNANEEVLELLFEKQLPFTEEEYLECLVFILQTDHLKSKTLESLKSISENVKIKYVEKREANHRVSYYILLEALDTKNEDIIAKIIQNQVLPHEFLIKIAENGNTNMLEMLLENQIKMIAYPHIMDVMKENPEINNFILGKIKEIEDFYLSESKGDEISEEEIIEDIQEIVVKEEQVEESVEESEELSMLEIQEKVVTTLQRINEMSVQERVKLSITGTKTERMILVKDPNKMVALSVIESPKITEDEIGIIIRDKSISGEIVTRIANNREWTKNYPIVLGLIQNPKTPVKTALGFVKQLHLKDLNLILKDKNVHYVVRNLAQNIFKEKSSIKKR
jgi:hypothetical protein